MYTHAHLRYAGALARVGDGPGLLAALEGGWRVYSSGPGLYLRLVLECPLGIRRRGWVVEVDPVMPPSLDGLTASVRLFDRQVEVAYRVGPIGSGPTRVTVGGHMLDAQRLESPYRTGGLSVQADDLHRLLDSEGARIDVEVS